MGLKGKNLTPFFSKTV